MHFEVLVEDMSGSIALDILLEKILGKNRHGHSWKLHPYKGIGRIPKNLQAVPNPGRRLLLNHLPMLLRGYGRSLRLGHGCVVVVVDLDTEDCVAFKQELLGVLATCRPPPTTLFRIAIEESEAWLLGDRDAVKAAYPKAKDPVLSGYKQDSICGTWEVLADAVHPGGSAQLKNVGYPTAGKAKCEGCGSFASAVQRGPMGFCDQHGESYSLVSHIFRTTPATIGGQRGPVATAS